MLTGFDNVLYTDLAPKKVLASFLRRIVAHWPKCVVLPVVDVDESARLVSTTTAAALIAESDAWIFCRDAKMLKRFDSKGYTLDRSGEGPLLIIAKRVSKALAAETVKELVIPPCGIPVEEYSTKLYLSKILQVTIVTPADPEEHELSARILDLVWECCGGPTS